MKDNYNLSILLQKEVIPSQVLRRTEAISRSMQNLLTSLKDGKQENILACSKRIIGAVRELILLFPESSGHPEVSEHISSLQSAAHEYRVLVLQTVKSNTNNSKSISLELLECAFDIAKSARQLENYFR